MKKKDLCVGGFRIKSGMTRCEAGRSMVEMLGVLAIMGIVGLVGVRMYTNAMTRHRANELIYEAQKRATMVASQLLNGRDTLSVAGFTDPAGYTFGAEKNPQNTNQFNITITGVDSKVCQQMKTFVGPATPIRVISNDCTEMTFNNDLSTTTYSSDYNQDEVTCKIKGYKWCTKGDNGAGTKCILSTSDCCQGTIYDSQCQSCDPKTGEVKNAKNTTPCDFNGDNENDSFCNTGVCENPAFTDIPCITNADCDEIGSGYYCNITSTTTGTNTDSLEQACYADLAGTCAVIADQIRLTAAQKSLLTKAGFKSTFLAGPKLNWWSARNWCKAQGKNLISVSDMECYYRNSNNTLINAGGSSSQCCKKGQTCPSNWSALWNDKTIVDGSEEEIAKFGKKVVALRKIYGENNFWTGSLHATATPNSCRFFVVYNRYGRVTDYRGDQYSYYTLCE